MYLLVILLISPAFGKPSFVRRDVGANIENQLDDLVEFSHETGNLLKDPKLLEKVSKSLVEAENNILEMKAHLETLQSKIPRTSSVDWIAISTKFMEAKSYLRQTIQELEVLAFRTMDEVNNMNILLDEHDKSKHPVLLKVTIDRMKILMKETKEILEEAKTKYHSANEAFDNLISSLKMQIIILEDAEIQKNCKLLEIDFFRCTYFRSTALGSGAVPLMTPIEAARLEVQDLEAKTDKFLEGTTILNVDIGTSIEIISEKLDQINNWEISCEQVGKNIDEYPQETLEKFSTMRNVFRNSLNDLYKAANQYSIVY